jgi:hypothetical protein
VTSARRTPYCCCGIGRGRTQGRVRAFESRHPTKCTNFCGADTIPLSPFCCDMAPQTRVVLSEPSPSIRSLGKASGPVKSSDLGRPGFRVGPLPTSVLPLPTTLSSGSESKPTRNRRQSCTRFEGVGVHGIWFNAAVAGPTLSRWRISQGFCLGFRLFALEHMGCLDRWRFGQHRPRSTNE